jgi:hypothetical protein
MPAAIKRFGETQPRYIVGNWYLPFTNGILAGGAAPGANVIRLTPFQINEPITISDLAVRISTLSVGGLCQAAIYACRPTSNLPGKLLGRTGSMSTTSAATVSAGIEGQDVKLAPGIYWFGINQDNATVAFVMQPTTSTNMARIIGSPTVTEVLETGSSTSRPCQSFTQTFGTWPDLTNATLAVSSNHAIGAFKVSAVG